MLKKNTDYAPGFKTYSRPRHLPKRTGAKEAYRFNGIIDDGRNDNVLVFSELYPCTNDGYAEGLKDLTDTLLHFQTAKIDLRIRLITTHGLGENYETP